MTTLDVSAFIEFYDIRSDGTVVDRLSNATIPTTIRRGNPRIKLQRSDGIWWFGDLKDLIILLDTDKKRPLSVDSTQTAQLKIWFYDNQTDHVTLDNLYYTTRGNLKKRLALEEVGDLYCPIYTLEPNSGWKLKWESLMQFAKGSGSDPYDIWNQATNEGTFQGLVLSFDEGFPKWAARMKGRLRELQKKFREESDV